MHSGTDWNAVSVLDVRRIKYIKRGDSLHVAKREFHTQVTQSLSKHAELNPSIPDKARESSPPIWANQCIVCSAEDKFEDVHIPWEL